MKPVFIIVFLALVSVVGYAQSAGNDITLGVACLDISKDLTEAQTLKLESKTIQMINSSGQATVGYGNEFVVSPVVSLEDFRVVEEGMENMSVATVEVTYYVTQAGPKMVVFNTYSRKVKGVAKNREAAIANAINNLGTSDKAFAAFLKESKDKIMEYYRDNCKRLMKRAAEEETKHNYEEAVSILYSIPAETKCHDQANAKALAVYTKYQKQLCENILQFARDEIAVENYTAALDALDLIDARQGCGAEANKLIAQIAGKVTNHNKQVYSLEVQRAKGVAAIATAYYSRNAKSSGRGRR
jgi:hypothetical protein